MSAPLLSRSPACLSCLRRSLTPAGSSSLVALTQVRGKKSGRQYDKGVLVRLLEDIPKFGRKHAVFLAPRGRMRNEWFHSKKAEYMTPDRFAELGLSKSAIGERDFTFGTGADPGEDSTSKAEGEAARAAKEPSVVAQFLPPEPAEALVLLDSLLPTTLTFARQPLHPTTTIATSSAASNTGGAPPRSPLLAMNAAVSAQSGTETLDTAPEEVMAGPAAARAIFGSVSAADVVQRVRESVRDHNRASLIALREKHVHIEGIGEGGGDNKVRSLGRWDVVISVPGGEQAGVAPVRRVLEVVEADGTAGP